MLAISTAWNYRSDADMRQMLLDIKAVGLNTVELGYKITVPQLARIVPLLDELKMTVSSVHNFCPLPDDHPSPRHPSNHYRLTSLDEEERNLAVAWTQRAVDTAVMVKAGVVVIHAGTIEIQGGLSESLIKQYKEGHLSDENEFKKLCARVVAKRRAAQGPFMEKLLVSLEAVMAYAEKRNIKIGLETRYYPTEMPTFEEIGSLLDRFHSRGMYYWHDFGHAEVNDRLGIYSHRECLDRYQDKIIGFHIHGVKVIKDHHAPFEGDFDLRKFFPYIKSHHLKVIESHGSATAEQIKKAVTILSREPWA